MSKETFKKLMIGVGSTVFGGIALLYGAEWIIKLFLWFQPFILWCWNFLISSHSLPGWVLLIVFLFSVLFIIVVVIYFLAKINKLKYLSYVEDKMFGATWRWQWMDSEGMYKEPFNILCYCPNCDTKLVYHYSSGKTYFICEKCNTPVIIDPNITEHSLIDRVKREIERKVRAKHKKITTFE